MSKIDTKGNENLRGFSNKTHFTKSEIIKGRLELLRPPNLFTVPGDILAGAFLGIISINRLHCIPLVITISLSLYSAGLLLNDYFDQAIDRVERPERPIPSGRVSPQAALRMAILLIFMALITSLCIPSFFWITFVLIFFIVLYNVQAKKIPLLGIVVMGMCRGCNLLLGAVISLHPFDSRVLMSAGVEFFYIAAVSNLARSETKGRPNYITRWMPLFSLISLFALLPSGGISLVGIFLISCALVWIFLILWNRGHPGTIIPEKVGDLIRGLILIQCVFITFSMKRNIGLKMFQLITIATLLVLFLTSGWVSQKFYGS